MNRHVNAIAGRLSLRPPQRRSLEILARITEIAPPRKGADVAAVLSRSETPPSSGAINATAYAENYGGKPWRYVLIPHDEIAENLTLAGLAARFSSPVSDEDSPSGRK